MTATRTPVRLTGPAALRWGMRFARDPLLATRRMHETHGPFVILSEGVPFSKPVRATMLGIPLVFAAGDDFNAEVLSDPETWRGVSVLPGGPKNSAARRMTLGLPRLTGSAHAHYRRLLMPLLRKNAVEAQAADMARLALAETASWPAGATVDLWDSGRRIMHAFSIALLFGGDSEQAREIALLAGAMMERKWDAGAFALPINVPFTAYGRIVRDAAKLERLILQWVAGKRGHPGEGDLASIIVNRPDASGNPADDAAIVAHIASLFALSSEGSQSALTWTLILLSQHPRIAANLRDEFNGNLGPGTLERAGELPYLDAVVRESMRILPPVPLQIRVAQRDTEIAGYRLPKGTRVISNTFLTNRMPDLYPDGDVFRPERWSALSPSAFAFPVFSAGPHICPGFLFGTLAVKIGLAAILMRFDVEVPAGTRIDYRAQPTLRPRRHVGLVLHRAADGKRVPAAIEGDLRSLVRFPL